MLPDYVYMTLSTVVFIYVLYRFRKEIKQTIQQLSIIQLTGIGISFIAVVMMATVLAYYGGNYLLSFIHIKFLNIITQYVIVIVVLVFSLYLIRFAYQKITINTKRER